MQSVKLPSISRSQTRPVWLPSEQQLPEYQPASSTFRSDFVRHSLPPMQDLRPKIGAYVSKLPFQNCSEQRAAYQGDPLVRRRVRVRRGQLAVSTEPFAAASTYSQEYITKQREAPENYKPRSEASLSEQPFHAASVYKCDFPRHDSNPTLEETRARAELPKQYQGQNRRLRTLDGSTEYQGNFLEPEASAVAKAPPGYRPPTEPMACGTSYSEVFVPFAGARPAPMFKPQAVAFQSDAPFAGRSLYKDDFVPQERRPPSAKVLENLSGVMTVARREEPGMPGVPIDTFPENLSGIMART